MKALIQVLIVTSVLLCSASPLSHTLAASSSPVMETLVVTYRNPADYALYTYTTEMLSVFRLEIREDISIQAHNGKIGKEEERKLRKDHIEYFNHTPGKFTVPLP